VTKKRVDLLIENASELITLQGWSQKPALGVHLKDLLVLRNGSVAIHKGTIIAVRKASEIKKEFSGEECLDASGEVVMPGFVDPHTHLVFAGSREHEFEMRVEGSSYMQILQKGGGIMNTVRETRNASKEQLFENARKTLDVMLEHGTTTVEAKSGYGLTLKDELKCLKVVQRLNNEHPVTLVPTFLGAHAFPPKCEHSVDEYVKLIIDTMIPSVAEQKLAEFCDAFCEKGVFNRDQSKRILLKGKEYGLKPKLHADEMTSFGGAELAAEVGAVSAEHLLFASVKGLKAMAKKPVVAILLPAAAFSLMLGKYANARKMIEMGVAVALGTDFNPSCWVESQQIAISLACCEMRMVASEAITATTINAAHAISRAHEVGSLEPGKKADVMILNVPNHKFLGYRFGANLVDKVIKEGKLVVEEGRLVS
jgi:imidazolonepropionase